MLVTYFVNFRSLNDHLIWKELFIRFTASAFCKLPSIYVCCYFPLGFEGRMWDLIVSVPDHCLSFYFKASYDFSPLYTILSHHLIKDIHIDFIKKMFYREHALCLACNRNNVLFHF